MRKKPNLMIIGASGGVANALLHHFGAYRHHFGKLVLVDKRNKVLSDPYVDHAVLDYVFVHEEIKLPKKVGRYHELLKQHEIDIVLDITDMATDPVLEATDAAGVTYVNTGAADERRSSADIISAIIARRESINRAPHILCTGMNPGNVNMWVCHGIERHGKPQEIVEFEYDTSKVAKKWHPCVTWSVHEFLDEAVRDPGGLVLGRNRIKNMGPNALMHRTNMRRWLSPIMKFKKYPDGLIMQHEENISLGYKYDLPMRYIYAVNPGTMQNIIDIYKKKGVVKDKEVMICDNNREILEGSDNIGVMLDYPDKLVYYFNTIPNVAVIGTNATYTQVVIGIFAGLFTLLVDDLKPGLYFVEDLYDKHYKYFMFDNMRVQEFVFAKTGGGRKLKLKSYNPKINLPRQDRFEHFYVI